MLSSNIFCLAPNNVAFSIGNLTVQWYGIILTSAMIIGLVLMILIGKQKGISSDDMIELFLWIIPLAVLFARIVYVVVRPSSSYGYFPVTKWGFKELFVDHYTPSHSFVNLFAIWEGGITIIGGVMGGILGGYIFCRKHKVSMSRLFDICVPVLLLCQGIGRWGNFFNQEAYGVEITNTAFQWFPFAVYINAESPFIFSGVEGVWHAATFFYAFVWNVSGAVLIYFLIKNSKVQGMSVFMYVVWYCFKRFFMEFIRQDAVVTDGGLYLTQLFMALCVVAGIVGGIFYYRHAIFKLEHQAVEAEIYSDSLESENE